MGNYDNRGLPPGMQTQTPGAGAGEGTGARRPSTGRATAETRIGVPCERRDAPAGDPIGHSAATS